MKIHVVYLSNVVRAKPTAVRILRLKYSREIHWLLAELVQFLGVSGLPAMRRYLLSLSQKILY